MLERLSRAIAATWRSSLMYSASPIPNPSLNRLHKVGRETCLSEASFRIVGLSCAAAHR